MSWKKILSLSDRYKSFIVIDYKLMFVKMQF